MRFPYCGAKLSHPQVIEIRIRAAQGEKLEAIASAMSVNRATISRIARGKLWKELGGPRTRRSPLFQVEHVA